MYPYRSKFQLKELNATIRFMLFGIVHFTSDDELQLAQTSPTDLAVDRPILGSLKPFADHR
jgi:hypothetical protein